MRCYGFTFADCDHPNIKIERGWEKTSTKRRGLSYINTLFPLTIQALSLWTMMVLGWNAATYHMRLFQMIWKALSDCESHNNSARGRDESFKSLIYYTRIGLPMRALKLDTFINGSYGPPWLLFYPRNWVKNYHSVSCIKYRHVSLAKDSTARD